MDEFQIRSFQQLGFAGPFDLVAGSAAKALTRSLSRAKSRMFFRHRVLSRLPLMDTRFLVGRWGTARWQKGIHAVSGEVYRLGADRRIVGRVSQVIGPDVLLSGSMIINQRPGDFHTWHVDAEQMEWNGVTGWLALENVSAKSTLRVVAGSQRIGLPPPPYDDVGLDDDLVLAEARHHDPDCRLFSLPAEPGQFYILARGLWHASRNDSTNTRYAIVLQYCRPDVPVRWPIQGTAHRKMLPSDVAYEIPCCLVSGEDRFQKNLVVAPPR